MCDILLRNLMVNEEGGNPSRRSFSSNLNDKYERQWELIPPADITHPFPLGSTRTTGTTCTRLSFMLPSSSHLFTATRLTGMEIIVEMFD